MAVVHRRSFIGGAAAALAAPAFVRRASAAEPILIGVPSAQSGPVGVADHQDWTNGVTLGIEEVNAAGGVNGRMLEMRLVDIDILTPEGTIAAFQSLVGQNVHAIGSAFTLIAQAGMDVAGAAGVPYLHGNTQIAAVDAFRSDPKKHRNTFMLDCPEPWYGSGFIEFIGQLADSGAWTPKNNRVHIVQEQIAYTTVISQAAQKAIAGSGGRWELAAVTDIQFPVQDWAPVVSALKATDAGVILISHWVAAELAAFCQTFAYDPTPGALVYLQYGPSQPEFLDLAAGAGEGFIWGTVYGVYNDERGAAFRAKYRARFPGTMGMVYTGGGYDTVNILAGVWKDVDPADFDGVGNALRQLRYRGVNGFYRFDPETQSGISYPNMTSDPEDGQAHLFFQVQDGEHRIIAPKPYDEVPWRAAPWM